jgi:hypothetical protein
MLQKILLIIVVIAIPGLSQAQVASDYRCTMGDQERRVQIIYETGVHVPCEVHYTKDTAAVADPQVLWRALNQAGYCEEKTAAFIADLKSWGWNCVEADGGPEAPVLEDTVDDMPPEDDTEALSPAEDATTDQ